jgi:3-oxoacyl-[acyl-carrier protein] reductase
MIATDMTGVLSDKAKEQILANIPLKRMGEPEEVAELAVFLAQNRYITGQVVSVDGGMA